MIVMKKINLFLNLFLFVFVCLVISLDVNAEVESNEAITSVGAQIRTVEPNGIRFLNSVNLAALGVEENEVKYYGTLVGYGTSNTEELVIGKTFNDKVIVNLQATSLFGDTGYFVGSIVGIPANAYTQKLTARAYIQKTDDTVVYSKESIVRSVYEVAKATKEDVGYVQNDFIDSVVDACKGVVTFDSNYTKSYDEIAQELLKDIQSVVGGNLTRDEYYALGSYTAPIGDLNNFVKSDVADKWRVLADYLISIETVSNNKDALTKFKNKLDLDAGNSETYGFAYVTRGIIGAASYNKNAYFITADYSNKDIQSKIAELMIEKTQLGFSGTYEITETPTREGYIFAGWYDNPECTGAAVTSVSGTTTLYAKWDFN